MVGPLRLSPAETPRPLVILPDIRPGVRVRPQAPAEGADDVVTRFRGHEERGVADARRASLLPELLQAGRPVGAPLVIQSSCFPARPLEVAARLPLREAAPPRIDRFRADGRGAVGDVGHVVLVAGLLAEVIPRAATSHRPLSTLPYPLLGALLTSAGARTPTPRRVRTPPLP